MIRRSPKSSVQTLVLLLLVSSKALTMLVVDIGSIEEGSNYMCSLVIFYYKSKYFYSDLYFYHQLYYQYLFSDLS